METTGQAAPKRPVGLTPTRCRRGECRLLLLHPDCNRRPWPRTRSADLRAV